MNATYSPEILQHCLAFSGMAAHMMSALLYVGVKTPDDMEAMKMLTETTVVACGILEAAGEAAVQDALLQMTGTDRIYANLAFNVMFDGPMSEETEKKLLARTYSNGRELYIAAAVHSNWLAENLKEATL